jgi:hypothetical protein
MRSRAAHASGRRGAALLLATLLASGCATVPPTYSEHELEERCVRAGGWWRPDPLMGGYCEFISQGAM